MKSIVFDLDDTICFPDHTQTDSHNKYAQALPNEPIIKAMQKLHAEGYTIIISSARRMITHAGDIDAIVADIGQLTLDWLKAHKVPYTEIHFGKPYSSTYYVDDKAMNLDQFLVWHKNA